MATIDYVAKAKSAEKLITKFGQAGVLQKFDKESGVEETSYAVLFVIMEYDDEERDGELVRLFDRKVIMAANAAARANPPTSEDRLKMLNGDIVRIIASRPFAPAGTAVFFDIQVRD